MEVIVNIRPKKEILDPQGKAVKHALCSLDYKNVKDVRIGQQIVIFIDCDDKEKAKQEIKKMCDELLVNLITQEYEIVI